MNLPTMQQAINAAIVMMDSDDAIESVEIHFVMFGSGLEYKATFDGIVRNIRRVR